MTDNRYTAARVRDLPAYLFAEIDRRKAAAARAGRELISFGTGNPDLPTPEPVVDELVRAARDPANHRYPDFYGLPEFRRAVADHYARRFGVALDPDTQVLPLIGSKDGIAHLPWAVTDPGDPVLVCEPAYPVYEVGARLAGARPVHVHLRAADDWFPDLDAIDPRLAADARILWLCYPSNPTAAVAGLDQLEGAVRFASWHRVLLAYDNAYSELTYDGFVAPSVLQVPGADEVAVEFGTLSKTFNMTGWRLGWMVGNREVVAALGRLKTNIDSGVFNAVQRAGVAALDGGMPHLPDLVATYQRRRDLIVGSFRKLGWDLPTPRGAMYVWLPTPPGESSVAFTARLLDQAGVVVAPGTGYGPSGEGYVRLTLAIPDARVEAGCERILGRPGHMTDAELAVLVTRAWAAATGDAREPDPRVGFVSAGGDSLAAARLLAGITRRCGVRVPLSRLVRDNWHLDRLLAEVTRAVAGGPPADDPDRPVPGAGGRRPGPVVDGPPPARAAGARAPLAPGQRRLWVWHRLLPGSPAYNVVRAVELHGRVDVGALRDALGDLAVRHDALRCAVTTSAGGVPELCLGEPRAPALAIETVPAGGGDHAVDRILRHWADRPIPMDRPPLYRAGLVAAPADGVAWLLLVLHHLVADQRASDVVLRDLASAYAARVAGTEPRFAAPAPSLLDHAEWELARENGPAWRADLGWWRERLAGMPARPRLPLARPVPDGEPGFRARVHGRALDGPDAAVLQRLGTTPAAFFLTALAATLAAWTGHEPLVIGVPAVRTARPEDADLVGFLVDTLPVRLELAGGMSFLDALGQATAALHGALDHAVPPFDAIVDHLRLPRAGTGSPLVLAWFNDTSQAGCPDRFGPLAAGERHLPPAWSLFDLGLYLNRDPDGRSFHLVHRDGLLDPADAAALLDQIAALAGAAAASPASTLAELARRAAAPVTLREPADGGPPGRRGPADRSVLPAHLAVRATAAGAGGAPALVDEGGTLSYAELEGLVDRVAAGLRRRGVTRGQVVAVPVRRDRDMVVSLLGIWRAGAVPALVDAAWPPIRAQAALAAAGWALPARVDGQSPAPPPPVRPLPHLTELAAGPAGERPPPRRRRDGGHVLFTSGTTGTPLGVRVGPGRVERFLHSYRRRFGIGPGDRVAFLSGPAHDPALRDVLAPLTAGASLWVPPARAVGDPARLLDWLGASQVTVLHATPLLLGLLAGVCRRPLAALRLVVSGGAPLPVATLAEVRRAAPSATVVNGYGCTETPQLVTAEVVPAGTPLPAGTDVPAGKPWPGCRVEVRDGDGHPLQPGQLGVVWVAEPSIADGYVDVGGTGREADRFRTDDQGRRWFVTDDLGRWDAGGRLRLAGRADRQVLVNDVRLEVDEVESIARTCPGVTDAVAAVRRAGGADALVLTVQASAGVPLRPERVQAHLAQRLPAASLPAAITVTGALQPGPTLKPDPGADHRPLLGPVGPAGDGAALEVLRQAVERHAGRRVEPDENFFDAGLTSLAMLALHAELVGTHGLELPVLALFQHPNLAALAGYLADPGAPGGGRDPGPEPLRSGPAGNGHQPDRERQLRVAARERLRAAEGCG